MMTAYLSTVPLSITCTTRATPKLFAALLSILLFSLGAALLRRDLSHSPFTLPTTPRGHDIHDTDSMSAITTQTYAARAANHVNPTAKRLLEIMERKQSNLCVSVDVNTAKEALEVVRRVGKSVCMVKVCHIAESVSQRQAEMRLRAVTRPPLKDASTPAAPFDALLVECSGCCTNLQTHCDIFPDFSEDFVQELTKMSDELDFIIFEDRKFADIGMAISLHHTSFPLIIRQHRRSAVLVWRAQNRRLVTPHERPPPARARHNQRPIIRRRSQRSRLAPAC